jgi:hypothetical protein
MNMNESFCDSAYEKQINMAERELAAFLGAVTELFGPEQARVSAEDWLEESELMDSPPRSTSRNWRAVTVAASARLANRLLGTQSRPVRCDASTGRLSLQLPIEEYRANPVEFEVAGNPDPVHCCTRAEQHH